MIPRVQLRLVRLGRSPLLQQVQERLAVEVVHTRDRLSANLDRQLPRQSG